MHEKRLWVVTKKKTLLVSRMQPNLCQNILCTSSSVNSDFVLPEVMVVKLSEK